MSTNQLLLCLVLLLMVGWPAAQANHSNGKAQYSGYTVHLVFSNHLVSIYAYLGTEALVRTSQGTRLHRDLLADASPDSFARAISRPRAPAAMQ